MHNVSLPAAEVTRGNDRGEMDRDDIRANSALRDRSLIQQKRERGSEEGARLASEEPVRKTMKLDSRCLTS